MIYLPGEYVDRVGRTLNSSIAISTATLAMVLMTTIGR